MAVRDLELANRQAFNTTFLLQIDMFSLQLAGTFGILWPCSQATQRALILRISPSSDC